MSKKDPSSEFLFTSPKRKAKSFLLHSNPEVWYEKHKLGLNQVANALPRLSNTLDLPHLTNSQIKTTSIGLQNNTARIYTPMPPQQPVMYSNSFQNNLKSEPDEDMINQHALHLLKKKSEKAAFVFQMLIEEPIEMGEQLYSVLVKKRRQADEDGADDMNWTWTEEQSAEGYIEDPLGLVIKCEPNEIVEDETLRLT